MKATTQDNTAHRTGKNFLLLLIRNFHTKMGTRRLRD
jgi:hypothetical protein